MNTVYSMQRSIADEGGEYTGAGPYMDAMKKHGQRATDIATIEEHYNIIMDCLTRIEKQKGYQEYGALIIALESTKVLRNIAVEYINK